MSEQGEAYVRVYGADMRERMARIYMANGEAMGRHLAKRFVGEVSGLYSEIHGAKAAVEMLYAAADDVNLGRVHVVELGADAGPDPLMQGLEGVVTLQEQTRQKVDRVGTALETLGGIVERMVDRMPPQPTNWAEYAWLVVDRVSWWPLAFLAGVLCAGVGR